MSLFFVYGVNLKSLFENLAVELIKAFLSTWDQTIVLSGSAIGEVAVFV